MKDDIVKILRARMPMIEIDYIERDVESIMELIKKQPCNCLCHQQSLEKHDESDSYCCNDAEVDF